MQSFRSILVDVDAAASAHPALERAVRIARSSAAKIEIADVMTIPDEARRYLRPEVEEELVDGRRQQLAKLASGIAGMSVESTLLHGRPATALIERVLHAGHDLLVRSHARDLATPAPASFGAIDMELIRKCPCPVLVVGPGAPPARPRIVAAVHASPDDPAEGALNEKIASLAIEVARLENGSVHLLQAWEPFAERLLRRHLSGDRFADYVDDARRHAEEDLERLARSLPQALPGVEVVLRRGEPEDAIPAFVVEQGIDLVVIGTIARTGIAGFFIGNTAERILRRLTCSVLTVKPDGFVSPVRVGA